MLRDRKCGTCGEGVLSSSPYDKERLISEKPSFKVAQSGAENNDKRLSVSTEKGMSGARSNFSGAILTCDICHVEIKLSTVNSSFLYGILGFLSSFGSMYMLWLCSAGWQGGWGENAPSRVNSTETIVVLIVLVGSLYILSKGIAEFLLRLQNTVIDDPLHSGWKNSVFPLCIATAAVVLMLSTTAFTSALSLFGDKMQIVVSASIVAVLLRLGRRKGASKFLVFVYLALWLFFCWSLISKL